MSTNLFGLRISTDTQESIAQQIVSAVHHGSRLTIYPANAHYLNLTISDRDYWQVMSKAEILTADGAAVVWALRLFGHRILERTAITDLVHPVLQAAANANLSVFFLGGTPGTAERAAEHFEKLYNCKILSQDGYFSDDEAMIQLINEAKPDILFVGLGAPKQEKWVSLHKKYIDAPIIITSGGLFDYYSGNVTRAPQFMQDFGLEWVYRMSLEPHRLWRRYLLGNPLFLLNVLKYRNSAPPGFPSVITLEEEIQPRRATVGAEK